MSLALPFTIGASPRKTAPSKNETLPVAVAPGAVGATVEMSVTG